MAEAIRPWTVRPSGLILVSHANLVTGEPPFFLKDRYQGAHPFRLGNLSKLRAVEGSAGQSISLAAASDDFRSVIDDLTVENKDLKHRLQKYEQFDNPLLQQDKLFEVRVHGLPPQKKQELEDLLRNFASGLEAPERDMPKVSAPTSSFKDSALGSSVLHRNPSSLSTSRPGDSGLGSSNVPTNNVSVRPRISDVPSAKANNNNIKSYLHNIPEAPSGAAPLTENARKKLVVRRLEQLFTGQAEIPTEHSQPWQQQEISASAARADVASHGGRALADWREGNREAKIMPPDVAFAPDTDEDQSSSSRTGSREIKTCGSMSGTPSSGINSPAQRPTRPLDLDLRRAQVPAENIGYIRHLGLLNPDIVAEAADGWVFFNLLFNMAQLHTFNVTPEFVRNAITEKSTKFELSSDGHQIRWLGGQEGSRLSSEIDSDDEMPDDYQGEYDNFDKSRTKRRKLDSSSGAQSSLSNAKPQAGQYQSNYLSTTSTSYRESGLRSSAVQDNPHKRKNPLDYRPLFYRQSSGSQSEVISSREGGMKLGPQRSTLRNPGEGPIVFYNRATFFTDLSGDPGKNSLRHASSEVSSNRNVLGLSANGKAVEDGKFMHPHSSLKSLMQLESIDEDGENQKDNFIDMPDFTFQPLASVDQTPDEPPCDFEVSGLGGVHPADNFTIDCRRSHAPVTKTSDSSSTSSHSRQQGKKRYTDRYLSTKLTSLPSSALPPPSLFILPFSSEDDELGSSSSSSESEEEDEDEDEDEEKAETSPDVNVPASFIRNYSSASTHGNLDSETDTSDKESDADSESEIDMLASARRQHPQIVAAQEREFDENNDALLSSASDSERSLPTYPPQEETVAESQGLDSLSVNVQIPEDEMEM